jgi:hypothetical protein
MRSIIRQLSIPQRLLLMAAFVFYLTYSFYTIQKDGPCFDEYDYMKYGIKVLKGNPAKTNLMEDSKMPVLAINVVPAAIKKIFLHQKTNDGGRNDLQLGRYLSILISVATGFYIFLWSHRLFGSNGALLSTMCWALCPNIIAHARLVGTDMFQALTALATMYHFWQYMKTSDRRSFIYFVIWMALAQISKQSNILLWLIVPFTALCWMIKENAMSHLLQWKTWTKILITIAVTLLVINASNSFEGTGRSLDQYHFLSKRYQQVSNDLGFIGHVPLPLPSAYVTGFDWVQYASECMDGHCGIELHCENYLNGKYAAKPFAAYYLVSFWYKTPIAFMLLMAVSIYPIGLVLTRKPGHNITANHECIHAIDILFPATLIITYFLFFSIFSNLQHGVRHILIVYACLYILIGSLGYWWNQPILKYLSIALLVFHISGLIKYCHSPIAYTNELLQRKEKAYNIFFNTNIDFGQCREHAEAFIKDNPVFRFPSSQPQPGKYIISLNNLIGACNDDKAKIAWLRDNFEPYSHFHYSYLLFDISKEEFNRKIK